MVSGEGVSEVKRRGGFTHYVVIPLIEHDHKNSLDKQLLKRITNVV